MLIESFKSRIGFGGYRPNHFEVIVNSPNIATLTDRESATFLIKAASLPASSVTDIPVMYRGREIHLVGERTFAPWTITVINEVGSQIREFFEKWHNGFQLYSETSGHATVLDYKAKLEVYQIDRHTNAPGSLSQPSQDLPDTYGYEYIFHGAYPIEVGEIGLSFDVNNAIEEFPVTFVYDYFVPKNRTVTTTVVA